MNTADYEKLAGFRSRPDLLRDLDTFRAALEAIKEEYGPRARAYRIAHGALITSPQPLAKGAT